MSAAAVRTVRRTGARGAISPLRPPTETPDHFLSKHMPAPCSAPVRARDAEAPARRASALAAMRRRRSTARARAAAAAAAAAIAAAAIAVAGAQPLGDLNPAEL